MNNIFLLMASLKTLNQLKILFLAIALVQLSFLDRLILALYTKNGHPWEL